MRQVQGGVGDQPARHVVDVRRHERAVDLELVDRELAQVGQRRQAGAVVVQGQADADAAEQAQRAHDAGGVAHDDRLGDLQAQARGRQPVAVQELRHPGGEARVEQVGGSDVDPHLQREAGVAQRGDVGQGELEHPQGQLREQPGVLHGGQEVQRRDQPARRVVPAHQRLQRADPAVLRVALGLQVHGDLVLGAHRRAEVGEHRHHVPRVLVEPGRPHLDGPGRLLGLVERDVGAAQDVRAVPDVARGDLGQPEAGAHRDVGPVDHDGLLEGCPDLAGQVPRRGQVHRQQQRELVTAEPRRQAPGRDDGLQSPPDLAQELVARAVAEAVVHHLEAVQVDQGQGAVAPGVLLLQHHDEGPPVRQPGQHVGHRLLGAHGQQLVLTDVEDHPHDGGHHSRRGQRHGGPGGQVRAQDQHGDGEQRRQRRQEHRGARGVRTGLVAAVDAGPGRQGHEHGPGEVDGVEPGPEGERAVGGALGEHHLPGEQRPAGTSGQHPRGVHLEAQGHERGQHGNQQDPAADGVGGRVHRRQPGLPERPGEQLGGDADRARAHGEGHDRPVEQGAAVPLPHPHPQSQQCRGVPHRVEQERQAVAVVEPARAACLSGGEVEQDRPAGRVGGGADGDQRPGAALLGHQRHTGPGGERGGSGEHGDRSLGPLPRAAAAGHQDQSQDQRDPDGTGEVRGRPQRRRVGHVPELAARAPDRPAHQCWSCRPLGLPVLPDRQEPPPA